MEKFWLALHLIGTAIGTGAVTTAYARELYFQYHPEKKDQRGSLPVITPLVTLALALVIISGFGLYLRQPSFYAQSTAFWIKMGLVAVLIANHIIINNYVRPRHQQLPTLAAISDYVSLVGWYLIITVSVLI